MIAMDPDQVFEVSLDIDAGKPVETRPTFVGRYLSAREWLKMDAILDEAEKTKEPSERLAKLVDVVAFGTTGWKNVKNRGGEDVVFDPKQLPDLLTIEELWELAVKNVRLRRLTEEQKKKSASQSDSASALSAIPAPAADATPLQ